MNSKNSQEYPYVVVKPGMAIRAEYMAKIVPGWPKYMHVWVFDDDRGAELLALVEAWSMGYNLHMRRVWGDYIRQSQVIGPMAIDGVYSNLDFMAHQFGCTIDWGKED